MRSITFLMHKVHIYTLIPLIALTLSSCMGITGKKHTYIESGSSVDVGGAAVDIDFKPQGTRSGSVMLSAMVVGGGRAEFDGPFAWRVEAYGEPGLHERLVVHRIRTRTEKTGRDEWFPQSELGKYATFKSLSDHSGKSRAR